AFLSHVHGGKFIGRPISSPQRIDDIARAPASQHLVTQLDELLRHRQAQPARYACDDDQLALLTRHEHLFHGPKFKVKSSKSKVKVQSSKFKVQSSKFKG